MGCPENIKCHNVPFSAWLSAYFEKDKAVGEKLQGRIALIQPALNFKACLECSNPSPVNTAIIVVGKRKTQEF
jgi:hypothetical protein